MDGLWRVCPLYPLHPSVDSLRRLSLPVTSTAARFLTPPGLLHAPALSGPPSTFLLLIHSLQHSGPPFTYAATLLKIHNGFP